MVTKIEFEAFSQGNLSHFNSLASLVVPYRPPHSHAWQSLSATLATAPGCSMLQSLNFTEHSSILSHLSPLTQLRSLHLSLSNTVRPYNHIKWRTLVASLLPLTQLTHLGMVSLHGTCRRLDDWLGSLPQLQSLELRHCKTGNNKKFLNVWAHCTQLTQLILASTDPITPGSLTSLSKLRRLEMSGNYASLGALPQSLEVMELKACGIQEMPDCLGTLTKLRRLNLVNNSLRELPDGISQCCALETLLLQENVNFMVSLGR